MEQWLTNSPWPGMVLWTLIYISDYYMTIASARKYQNHPNLGFEGSFELTPQFQKDVDALKPISRRHILMLLLTNILLLFLWWLFSLVDFPQGFLLPLGMFLLMEVAVHFRHFRTYHLLTQVEKHGGMEGRVVQSRWLTYNTSAFELLSMGVLFLLASILTFSLFFFGGALACFALAYSHHDKYLALFRHAARRTPQP